MKQKMCLVDITGEKLFKATADWGGRPGFAIAKGEKYVYKRAVYLSGEKAYRYGFSDRAELSEKPC